MNHCAQCGKSLEPSYWQHCLPQLFKPTLPVVSPCCSSSYCSVTCFKQSICADSSICKVCRKIFLGESIPISQHLLNSIVGNQSLGKGGFRLLSPSCIDYGKLKRALISRFPMTWNNIGFAGLKGGGRSYSSLPTAHSPLLSNPTIQTQQPDCFPTVEQYQSKTCSHGWLDANSELKGDYCLMDCARLFPQCCCRIVYSLLQIISTPLQKCIAVVEKNGKDSLCTRVSHHLSCYSEINSYNTARCWGFSDHDKGCMVVPYALASCLPCIVLPSAIIIFIFEGICPDCKRACLCNQSTYG